MLRSFRYTTGFGFGLLLLLMGALIGFGLKQMQHVQNNLRAVVEEQNRKINIVTDMQVAGYQRSDSLYQMMLAQGTFERDALFMDAYNPSGFAVGSARAAFQRLPLNAREQAIFADQSALIEEVVTVQDEIVERLLAGADTPAQLLMLRRAVPLQEAINDTFDGLRGLQAEAAGEALASAQRVYRMTYDVFLGIGVLFLAIGALVAAAVFHKTGAQARTIAASVQRLEASRQMLQHAADHDPLTDLPNRGYFDRELARWLAAAAEQDQGFSLLYFDLDGFKQVNDRLGHHAGDALLQAAAARLRAALSPGDFVARIGGDEFVVLVDRGGEEAAAAMARCVLERFAEPVAVEDTAVELAASVGVGLFPYSGTDADTLMRQADHAMYRAKTEGSGIYRFAESMAQTRAPGPDPGPEGFAFA